MNAQSLPSHAGLIDARQAPDRARAVARAAEALNQGHIIGLPTDTVYAFAASAASADAVEALWKTRAPADASAPAERSLLAWHAASAEDILAAIPVRSEVHRRLIERLSPGAVTFSVEMDEKELGEIRTARKIGAGVVDDGTQLLIRSPAQETARQVIGRVSSPVVMLSALSNGQLVRTAVHAADVAPTGIMLLDDGSSALGTQSTLIRLLRDGGYLIAREGAIEERYVRKQLTVSIVFVCTGNTCRSPMAAAIARDLLAKSPPEGFEIAVRSAGVGAASGARATPEAAEAVRRMGIDMGAHASSFLSREMISSADIVYTMTVSHAEAARGIDPMSAARVLTLDPEGKDIPDPFGAPQETYNQTAAVIAEAIRRRMAEWPGSTPPER